MSRSPSYRRPRRVNVPGGYSEQLTVPACATGAIARQPRRHGLWFSALRLGPEIHAFLTYDDRQASVAHELGLTVESPGQHGRK